MVERAGVFFQGKEVQIWGAAYLEQPHLLRVNISNLRRKIDPEPTRPGFILTELGVGVRMKMNP